MVFLKHVLMPDAFCASTAPTQTVLKATSRVAPTRYLARRLVAQSASSISSVAKCAWDGLQFVIVILHSTFSAIQYQRFGPLALAAPYYVTYYLNTVLGR